MRRCLVHVGLTERWLTLNRHLTFKLLRVSSSRAEALQYDVVPDRILYIAASSLPYHMSGYTTRTHEVILALTAADQRVHVLTRPGYPWDRRDRLRDADSNVTVFDRVHYTHTRHPANRLPVLQYSLLAASAVAKVAMQKRVAVIQAASNHVNALPALLAARRLGIPFQYEMRGLWELTRVSRMPDFVNTEAYKQGLQLEGLVASQADRLFVISEQLGAYAREHWGVRPERMALLPNCIDPTRFVESSVEEVEPNTVGYAGTLIGYEGLDTLIDAAAIQIGQDRRVQVVLIGEGEARAALEEQVSRLGMSEHMQFLGRLSPDEARARLARCALVAIPRKPFEVCKIVPPIKLVEALAMGKPVIVPDLPVFRDELGASEAGWFFKSGDAADLARVIDNAFADTGELQRRGERARQHVLATRCWSDFVGNVLPR